MTVTSDHPFLRRLLAGLLFAYGLLGMLLVVGGGVLVASSVARLDGLATTLSTQRQVLVRSLDATATFLHDARAGSANVQTSLSSAVDSARQTAVLTRSLASAMDQLVSASSVSFFGTQPFGALGASFGDVSRQATTLGNSLDRTADAMARNGQDLNQVGGDLSAIETEIAGLRTQVAGLDLGADDVSSISRAIDTSRFVLFGLLGWLAAQAIIAFVAGLLLWRWVPEIVVAEPERASPGLPLDDLV